MYQFVPGRRLALIAGGSVLGYAVLFGAALGVDGVGPGAALLALAAVPLLTANWAADARRRSAGAWLEVDGAGLGLARPRGRPVRVAWPEVAGVEVRRRWPHRLLVVRTRSGAVEGLELTGWDAPAERVLAAATTAAGGRLPTVAAADGEAGAGASDGGEVLAEVRPWSGPVLLTGAIAAAAAAGMLAVGSFLAPVAGLLGAGAAVALAVGVHRWRLPPVLRLTRTGVDLRIWSRDGWDLHRDWAQVESVSVEWSAGSHWLLLRLDPAGGLPDPQGVLSSTAGGAPQSVADPARVGPGYALNGLAFRPSPTRVVTVARAAAGHVAGG